MERTIWRGDRENEAGSAKKVAFSLKNTIILDNRAHSQMSHTPAEVATLSGMKSLDKGRRMTVLGPI